MRRTLGSIPIRQRLSNHLAEKLPWNCILKKSLINRTEKSWTARQLSVFGLIFSLTSRRNNTRSAILLLLLNCTETCSESPAVDGGVADVLALDEVDDVLGDVGGVVADALEVLGDENQFERGKDHAGIAHHVSQ